MCHEKTVYKWIWVWDFEKGENWLNEMARNGWVLDKVSFCTYHFISCEPGEYTIRLAMRNPNDTDYIDFIQESGAKYIGNIFQWLYFRQRINTGNFEIFSDLDSRITHLNTIAKSLGAVSMLNIIIGIMKLNEFSWINLLVATVIMYALGRIHGKKESLEKERLLHE